MSACVLFFSLTLVGRFSVCNHDHCDDDGTDDINKDMGTWGLGRGENSYFVHWGRFVIL